MDLTIDETVQALVNSGSFWFGGPAPIDRIDQAQEALGIKFPAAFVVWLLRYGGGGARGSEISGVYAADDDPEHGSVVGDTMRLRETVGLPQELIAVLCNTDQAPWCLLVDPAAAGDCPVVSFDDGTTTTLYRDFDEFFADYVVAWAHDIGSDLRKTLPPQSSPNPAPPT
jgi:hypothetical protein